MRAFRLPALAAALLACAGAAHAAPPEPAGVITNPDWIRKPNMDQLRAVWPVALHGRDGHALIHCRVAVTGALEGCDVVTESPEGSGVGAAALLLAPNFVMRPAMRDGQPVATGTVSIPINFKSNGQSMVGTRVMSIVHPLWAKAPTSAEVGAVTPPGVSGHAAMRCVVQHDGTLHECAVLSEEPTLHGLGSAARKLAPRFQLVVDPNAKPEHAPVQVTVAVSFAPPEAGPRYITVAEWRLHPSASQTASIFPVKAAQDGMKTGRVVLDCVIKADGGFGDCAVDSEDPPGEDFGGAAKRLTTAMALAAWTQDGHPVDGAHIRVPVRLNLGDGADAAPTPAH